MVLDATLLNAQHYKVWIKGKLEQSSERNSALPYSYRKGNLRVTLDYGSQLYLQLTYEYLKPLKHVQIISVW